MLSFPPSRPNLNLTSIIVRDDDERRQEVVKEILGNRQQSKGSDDIFFEILSKKSINKRQRVSGGGTANCSLVKSYSALPTIIYVWRRDEAESLADYLKSQNVSAAAYHAGMERSQRSRVQVMFNKGTLNVVVATVAFGMGIDKSNVRRVVHASLPKSVENYVQVLTNSFIARIY